jgi:hypothetical protein
MSAIQAMEPGRSTPANNIVHASKLMFATRLRAALEGREYTVSPNEFHLPEIANSTRNRRIVYFNERTNLPLPLSGPRLTDLDLALSRIQLAIRPKEALNETPCEAWHLSNPTEPPTYFITVATSSRVKKWFDGLQRRLLRVPEPEESISIEIAYPQGKASKKMVLFRHEMSDALYQAIIKARDSVITSLRSNVKSQKSFVETPSRAPLFVRQKPKGFKSI